MAAIALIYKATHEKAGFRFESANSVKFATVVAATS